MKINKATNTMSMVRGDSDGFFVCRKINKVIDPLLPGDIVYFTVKENYNKVEKVFQKTITKFEPNGMAFIEIEPADTKALTFNTEYAYDIQITKADGKVYTIVEASVFTVRPEVTYE